jgi:membrane protein implicated in regulation of membrane protease activity
VILQPKGTVFYRGELWNAVTTGEIAEVGEEVIITGIEGLTLHVTSKNTKQEKAV